MLERRMNARGIIYDNNQIFAQKYRTHEGGESDNWGTPGGGVDPGESLIEGLRREIIEETGIAPKVGKLLFIQQFFHARHTGELQEKYDFFFHIENAADYHTIDLVATSHGMQELTRCEFINPRTEYLLPAFLQTINIQDYISGAQPVLVVDNLHEHEIK